MINSDTIPKISSKLANNKSNYTFGKLSSSENNVLREESKKQLFREPRVPSPRVSNEIEHHRLHMMKSEFTFKHASPNYEK